MNVLERKKAKIPKSCNHGVLECWSFGVLEFLVRYRRTCILNNEIAQVKKCISYSLHPRNSVGGWYLFHWLQAPGSWLCLPIKQPGSKLPIKNLALFLWNRFYKFLLPAPALKRPSS